MIDLSTLSKGESAHSLFKITNQAQQKKNKKLATFGVVALLLGIAGITMTFLQQSPIEGTAYSSQNLRMLFDGDELESETMKAYIKFVAEYGKTYASKSHQEQKYKTFKKNYQKIQHHNKHAEHLPFEMEVNQFADLTPSEFLQNQRIQIPQALAVQNKKVHVHSEYHYKHHVKKGINVMGENLPENINWFEKGAVSSPSDQFQCGSCWAFTTAATLESLAVISGNFEEPPEFSMQQLIDCDKSNSACDGGWMYKAYDYVAKKGIMLREDYPYVAKEGECNFESSKTVFKNLGMVQELALNNDQLKAIVAKQPVGVGIKTTDGFSFYKKGIMTEEFLQCSDENQAVTHGVTVVGYGKTNKDDPVESGWCEQYWIVKNTWGLKWGENGFFRLCMDGTGSEETPYGICQLNRYPTYPTMVQGAVDNSLLQ